MPTSKDTTLKRSIFMQAWQHLLAAAQHYTQAKRCSEAEGCFLQALDILEQQRKKNPKCMDRLQAWLHCQHQLACLYQGSGQANKAQQCLLIAHDSMLNMAKSKVNDQELFSTAIKAMQITLLALQNLQQKTATSLKGSHSYKHPFIELFAKGASIH